MYKDMNVYVYTAQCIFIRVRMCKDECVQRVCEHICEPVTQMIAYMSVHMCIDVYTSVCICAWLSLCWTKNRCERV